MPAAPVLNLKPSAEKFEERMIIKMIVERIIKELLKSKIIYSFELIYSPGLVPGITSLSMFVLMRPESLLSAGLAKSLVLKKCFCFHQEINVLAFLQMEHVNFRKDVNSIIHGKTVILQNQARAI